MKCLKKRPIYIRLNSKHRYCSISFNIPSMTYLGVFYSIFQKLAEISRKDIEFYCPLSLSVSISKTIQLKYFSTPTIIKDSITKKLTYQRILYVYSHVDWNILKSNKFSKSKGFQMEDKGNYTRLME